MAVQTVEQVQRLPPYLEGLQKRLLQSLFGQFDGATQTTPGLLDSPIDLPDFKLAGFRPITTDGIFICSTNVWVLRTICTKCI